MSSPDHRQALDDLHQRLHSCRLCIEAGFDVFPQAIFSGDLGAQIMIIGQAPGVTEVEARRPFNAGSGTRLFQWLHAAGIEENAFRSTQYMTSVTKCYPGKVKNGSGDRVPTGAERAYCRPYLDEEITLINPALILPIGRLAINLYFDSRQPLAQIIGTGGKVDDRWIVPLPHPSGASRWHQVRENQLSIQKAIELIRVHRRDLHL